MRSASRPSCRAHQACPAGCNAAASPPDGLVGRRRKRSALYCRRTVAVQELGASTGHSAFARFCRWLSPQSCSPFEIAAPPWRRPPLLRRLPRVLQLAAKALFQLLTMLWLLLVALPRPDVILLQLPPALPTMLVCRLAALRHRCRLVFDWHNFAYTLMAIGMGRGHPVVRFAGLQMVWH